MGQAGKKSAVWTGAELKILMDIKQSGLTVKESMHLLPGRTYIAIKQQMVRLPGGTKKRGRTGWVFLAMQRVLTETPNLTNAQLAVAVGCTRNAICGVLNVELGKRIYIGDWTRAGSLWAAQYALGNRPNAPKPPPRTREESYQAQKIARDAIKRARNPFAVVIRQVVEVEAWHDRGSAEGYQNDGARVVCPPRPRLTGRPWYAL
ncbi:hypothetical protein PQR01_00185 [Paraburkholderia rhynchosiae]|uniref:Uncharacterized protein n=1 Tax=Paraburkholderia rhynchosiae TaxID=487049 RepID=A0ACC7N887_9BURK